VIAPAWHRNAVVYSLSVETFMDGNGDGIGDFAGLSSRLDYLESLGIDAIWLAPSQPSPNRDDGYDVADHYGIDRRYGSSGDFADFMHEADGRGIRVLLDLVVNHTSDRHPWFRDACRSSDSRYRSWYVWSKRRPRDARSGIVFPGVQKTTWTYEPTVRAWYFHRFYEFQPDLNIDNPQVRDEIKRIVTYWLRLGVAGFRVDAVPFLIEKPMPGRSGGRLEFRHLRELHDTVRWNRGDSILLGEANIVPREDSEYFAGGEGLDSMFNFWVNQHLFLSLATEDARPLAAALRATADIPVSSQWAHFLRNHDELDLGRLSAAERKLCFDEFGPEPAMQLYGRGIRRRPAPMLGDPRRLRLAYSILFSLPGTPVLRYGDEIGMGDDLRLRERNAIRTPMQWSAEPNAGFSTAETLVRPVIRRGVYGYEHVNVEEQRREPGSLLQWTARMIRLRKQCPEIGWGDWRIVPAGSSSVLAVEYRWRGNAIVCLHNLDDVSQETKLRLGGGTLANLIDVEEVHTGRDGLHRVALEPYGYRWFRLGEVTQALARESVD
jgi:maltose alpha-D-glucosyltransferase / alpha-amylase